MNWTLVFILAMPALFAAFVFGMYKFGVGKTDWNAYPSAEVGPYEEPSDLKQIKIIGTLSLILYVLMILTMGPFAAAVVLAVLLALLAVGSLIVTIVQEIIFRLRGPKIDPESGAIVERRPFFRRWLWNFFNSFEILGGFTP